MGVSPGQVELAAEKFYNALDRGYFSDLSQSDQNDLVELLRRAMVHAGIKVWGPTHRKLSTEEEGYHWGRDPGHGGFTQHKGPRQNCSGPDCS